MWRYALQAGREQTPRRFDVHAAGHLLIWLDGVAYLDDPEHGDLQGAEDGDPGMWVRDWCEVEPVDDVPQLHADRVAAAVAAHPRGMGAMFDVGRRVYEALQLRDRDRPRLRFAECTPTSCGVGAGHACSTVAPHNFPYGEPNARDRARDNRWGFYRS